MRRWPAPARRLAVSALSLAVLAARWLILVSNFWASMSVMKHTIGQDRVPRNAFAHLARSQAFEHGLRQGRPAWALVSRAVARGPPCPIWVNDKTVWGGARPG